MENVLHVVAARPNFMKVAPLWRALERRRVPQRLVHTGQHHGEAMSGIFFRELGLPEPDVHLGVGSGTHAEAVAKVMVPLERELERNRPGLVSVVGDVHGTLAAALVAARAGVLLAHVEAGLRSFDRSMPEELNRVLVDRMADLLLVPSPDAEENLLVEGAARSRIHMVGNVMVDALRAHLPAARALGIPEALGLPPGGYAVATLHRPSNVDDPVVLEGLLSALVDLSRKLPVVFPLHPRTAARLGEARQEALRREAPGLRLVPPQGYLPFLSLAASARLVLTDSGGLQEETTALGIPCLTLRENTEWPVTVTVGTNVLVGTEPEAIREEAERVLRGEGKRGRVPDLWDGRAAERVADVYARLLGGEAQRARG